MLILISLLSAIIPMFIYLLILWWLDKYERESFGLVLVHFFWGAVGAIFFAILGTMLLSVPLYLIKGQTSNVVEFQTVLIAPLIEEFTKGIFLFVTALTRSFDNITDGLVYGGAIGLGFGMTENFMYFISYGETLEQLFTLIILRTAFTGLVHCISTATFGVFIAIAKFSYDKKKTMFVFLGYLFAVSIHSFWNISVTLSAGVLISLLFMVFAITIFALIFIFSLSNERKIILQELNDEVEQNYLSQSFVDYVNNRIRKKADKKLFDSHTVKNAVILAFRKHQARYSDTRERTKYLGDVALYREKLKGL